jgi:serine/threonine protein kinase
VLPVYEYFEEEDLCIYSMEYLDGGNLSERIQRSDISFEQIYQILDELCDGLTEIHQNGIVHGALHPGNILFTDEGNVKIADAGLAHTILGGGSHHPAVSESAIDYLSPEQFQHSAIDQRSDIYAVGLLGYKMITGKLPGSSITSTEEIKRRFKAEFPGPRTMREDCPSELHDVIATAIRLDPERRYQTIDELQIALRNSKPVEQEVATPPSLTIVPERSEPSSSSADYQKSVAEKFYKPGSFWSTVAVAGLLVFVVAAIILFENKQLDTSDPESPTQAQAASAEAEPAASVSEVESAKVSENTKAAAEQDRVVATKVVAAKTSSEKPSDTKVLDPKTVDQALLDLEAVQTTLVAAKAKVEEKKQAPTKAQKKEEKQIETKAQKPSAPTGTAKPEKKVAAATKATKVKSKKPVAKAAEKTDGIVHTVRYKGESLSIIADWYLGSVLGWKKLAKANPSIVAAQVEIGDVIVIPRDLVKNDKPFEKSHIKVVLDRMKR